MINALLKAHAQKIEDNFNFLLPENDEKYKKVTDGYALELPEPAMVPKLIAKYPKLFADFEVIKGKMDDVFLTVTGKKLQGGKIE